MRFYGLTWEQVMPMHVAVWSMMAEAMPALVKEDTLAQVQVLVMAGQRGIDDQDYKRAMEALQSRPTKKLSPEKQQEFEQQVGELNRLWNEAAAARGY